MNNFSLPIDFGPANSCGSWHALAVAGGPDDRLRPRLLVRHPPPLPAARLAAPRAACRGAARRVHRRRCRAGGGSRPTATSTRCSSLASSSATSRSRGSTSRTTATGRGRRLLHSKWADAASQTLAFDRIDDAREDISDDFCMHIVRLFSQFSAVATALDNRRAEGHVGTWSSGSTARRAKTPGPGEAAVDRLQLTEIIDSEELAYLRAAPCPVLCTASLSRDDARSRGWRGPRPSSAASSRDVQRHGGVAAREITRWRCRLRTSNSTRYCCCSSPVAPFAIGAFDERRLFGRHLGDHVRRLRRDVPGGERAGGPVRLRPQRPAGGRGAPSVHRADALFAALASRRHVWRRGRHRRRHAPRVGPPRARDGHELDEGAGRCATARCEPRSSPPGRGDADDAEAATGSIPLGHRGDNLAVRPSSKCVTFGTTFGDSVETEDVASSPRPVRWVRAPADPLPPRLAAEGAAEPTTTTTCRPKTTTG